MATVGARVLAIESSCDETACAVTTGSRVEASVVASQIEVHARFGGVVPELASRHHLGSIVHVVREAMARARLAKLSELDAIAVTEGPGLVGALLVGVQLGRALAAAASLPIVGVHHMEGHLFSAVLGDDRQAARPFEPHLALLVSGGHTELALVRGLADYVILGATRDDAVGEAYDKVAKMLGLGYPGGPVIDRLAGDGDPGAILFPRAMLDQDNLDFSFSGLKTAVLTRLEKHGEPGSREELCDLCASFQAAVVEVLVSKTVRAQRATQAKSVHAVGGVAANRGLRSALARAAGERGFSFVAAEPRYCGDNAAMIAAAAAARIEAGLVLGVDVHSNRTLEDARVSVRGSRASVD